MDDMPIVTDIYDAMTYVMNENYAFMDDKTSLEYYALQNCEISVADETFNKAGFGFVLSENAEYLESFNRK